MIQLGELSQHLPRHLLGAAPDGTDSDPLSAQIRHRLIPVRVAAEHHERLGRAEASDQLERMCVGPRQPFLDEGEMDAARGFAGGQLRDVLDRSGGGQIVDAPALALRFGGQSSATMA